MIDSTNLMLVAIPTTGCCNHPTEKFAPVARPDFKPDFAPVKGQTIITENGYAVHIPHMIGSETTVKKLGDGYYLVTSRPVVYGAKPKKVVMTEEELVERFNGKKVILAKDENSAEAKLQKAILQLLTTEPQICYEA